MPSFSQASANADCAALAARAVAAGCSPQAPRVIYVSPGSRSTPLVIAFDEHPAIELRVVLDERAAAFAALGAATASGRLVCTLCTSGSAAAHALPAVMEAFHGGAPMLVLTADRPLEAQGIGAAQTTAQADLYKDHARATFCLPAPVASDAPARRQVEGQWRLTLARAIQAAEGPVPGPVHVNVPLRDPLGHEPSARTDWPDAVQLGRLSAGEPEPAALEAACAILRRAARVAVVVGPALPSIAAPAPFAAALSSLAARAHWPVFSESSANVAGEDAPVWIHGGDALASVPELLSADVWLHIGLPPSGRDLLRYVNAPSARHIIVHPPGMPIDGGHVGDVFFEGAPEPWLLALSDAMGAPAPEQIAFEKMLHDKQRALLERLESDCAGEHIWFEGAALRDIARASAPETCFLLGNSLTVRDVDTFAAIDPEHARDRIVLARRGISGIDGALAHAAGVASELSRRPLVCLFGDLTFLYDVQSLRLLAQEKSLVQVFVLDNAGGEIFTQLPIGAHVERTQRLFRTPQQVDAQALCRAQGARFVRCESRAQLTAYHGEAAERRANGNARQSVDVVWLAMGAEARAQRRAVRARFETAP